jgi:hypothetical protein
VYSYGVYGEAFCVQAVGGRGCSEDGLYGYDDEAGFAG